MRRRHADDGSQCQRQPSLDAERRVAATEQHRQSLVARTLGRSVRGRQIRIPLLSETDLASAFPEQIDGPAPRRERQPSSRIGWHPVATPGSQCDDDRLLDCLFGDVEVAEPALQLSNDQTSLTADDAGECGVLRRGLGGVGGVPFDRLRAHGSQAQGE